MTYDPETLYVKVGVDEFLSNEIMIMIFLLDKPPVEPSKKASGIFHKPGIPELIGGFFRKFSISPVSGQVQCIEGQV